MSFNLLVSCPRGKESMARSELAYFLSDLGDNAPRISKTRFSGLLEAFTSLDPFIVVERAKEEALENPWNFRYVTKIVPIEKVVSTNLDEITKAARELENELSKCESFRVTVVKRDSSLEGNRVVSEVASLSSQRVDLKNPSCVFLIEVVGEVTGIAILKKSVFSLQRTINGVERITKI
ncbi:MAG TPA: RNA methyltransferase [Thermoprotei archaeon]|nr:RNA methyltransferase [Thermoprotei archaeon]